MIEKYLSPGDKVELIPQRRPTMKEETASRIYITKVSQILDGDKLEVMMPIEQSKIILLPRNSLYTVVIYTSNGLYQCEAKVGERYKSGNIYMQVLELTKGIKRYQRREYYRYSCSVPLFCRTLTEEEKKNLVWDETLKGKEGQALDIGGGGIRFIIDEEFQPEDMVVCYLQLEMKSGIKEIQGAGKVLSIKPVKDSTRFFEVRVQFEKMSNAMREQIIQFIFEDERKRRKKSSGL